MSRGPKYLLTALSLTACTQLESPVAPPDDVFTLPALARAELQSRPWSSRCEGTAMFLDPTTLRITGDCNITHIGRATFATIETVIPGPEGSMLNAVNTYTAANGDQLHTTSSGIAVTKPDFSGVTFSGIETAIGGTGRFRNATGRATRIGSTRFSDLRGSYRNVGELTYDASDGKR